MFKKLLTFLAAGIVLAVNSGSISAADFEPSTVPVGQFHVNAQRFSDGLGGTGSGGGGRGVAVGGGRVSKPAATGEVIKTIRVNGHNETHHFYKGIKYAPKYPDNFRAANKITHNKIKDTGLLSELRQAESGTWTKVYRDGYIGNKKVSIHYFESKSGLVFDVKVKNNWSNK